MSLATAADLIVRYDVRRLSELNSDTGTPVTPTDSVSTPVGICLADAAEIVFAALQQGNRYTRDQLVTLVTSYPTSRGAVVKRVVCDIAFARLLMRRGLPASEIQRQVPGYQDSLSWLELLRQGKNILHIDGALAAQVPESAMDRDYSDPNRPTNFNRMFGRWPAGETTYATR